MPTPDPQIATELLSHQAFLTRLAIDLVGDDAEDLVQDVWQRALERPPHHGRQLRGWLARVARNLAANRWRGEARRAEREARWASERLAEDDVEARFELRMELVQALRLLSPTSRATLLLRYFEGLAPRDIARRQDLSVETVKTRLRRGLNHLREVLDKRCGGDRSAWMSAVAALGLPVGSGVGGGVVGTGTVMIGGLAMGTVTKVSAAVVVAAVVVYMVARPTDDASLPVAVVDPQSSEVDVEGTEPLSVAPDPVRDVVPGAVHVADEPPVEVSIVSGTRVLRVVLEGITEQDARRTRVTLNGVDERRDWPTGFQESWACQGSTSDFDLDPFFSRVEGATNWDLNIDGLEVKVCHPQHRIERVRTPLSRGIPLKSGQTLYHVRVRLSPGTPHVFWPEFTLSVRDAHTREHLEDVELRAVPTAFMGLTETPGGAPIFTALRAGLNSPIGLLGGREADAPEHLAGGLALATVGDQVPQLLELMQPEETERGVVVYARAPGYAWGSLVLDVSKSADRELLLWPGSALDLRLTNVQLDRYAELGTEAMLWIYRQAEPGEGRRRTWHQRVNETLVTEGLRLDNLGPGEFEVSVLLGRGWEKTPVLVREEFTLAVGETRELMVVLADPPAPEVRATLGGVLSFPSFGGEEDVRLLVYHETNRSYRDDDADRNLTLTDMERVGGALPTWSFRMEALPVGRYLVQIRPFMNHWMVELPENGREDVELRIPEFAEVIVETVDARTGERIPLDQIGFRRREEVRGPVRSHWVQADSHEPGRFRFWTAPGVGSIWPSIPDELDYGSRKQDLDLVAGLQSVRFELSPAYSIRIEFHDGGAALPRDDDIWVGLTRGIRAVGHEGRVTANYLPSDRHVEVSAAGLYEISFEGIGSERFHPILPRRVTVRPGETAEVIVELRRK